MGGKSGKVPFPASYYAVKKVFVKFFAKFFEVFAKSFKAFTSFLRFSRAFRGFSLSDPFGPIGMHSDAFGSNWKRLDVFEKSEIFEIFESFLNVSGCDFEKILLP